MMNYPLDLRFKIATIGTRVRVTDAGGNLVAYVRKKKFKLKEDVGVYADEDQRKLLFRIKADRMLDFFLRVLYAGAAPLTVLVLLAGGFFAGAFTN